MKTEHYFLNFFFLFIIIQITYLDNTTTVTNSQILKDIPNIDIKNELLETLCVPQQNITCNNHGSCVSSYDSDGHYCNCYIGYYGVNCEFGITTQYLILKSKHLVMTIFRLCTPKYV